MGDSGRITIESYDTRAAWYAMKQQGYNLTPVIDQFLSFVPGKRILDLGCGNGRDARAFIDRGCSVVGIDAAPELLTFARQTAPGAEFLQMDFSDPLGFPDARFDGVWASTSLVHLRKQQLPAALREIYRILCPDGVFLLAMKKGEGEEMIADVKDGERFFAYYQPAELEQLLTAAGFTILSSQENRKKDFDTRGKAKDEVIIRMTARK